MRNNVITIFLLILSAGIFYIYIEPRYQNVQTLIITKGEYTAALEKGGEVATTRDELLTKYNSISKDNMTRLERILPNNLNTVKLVADMNSVAGRHGITIRNIGVTEPVADNGQEVATLEHKKQYQTTTIHFQFDSSYQNLKLFLRDLEKSLQLIDVQTIKLSHTSDTSDIFSYDVMIQTYWVR